MRDLRLAIAEALGAALRHQRRLHHPQGWSDYHGQEGRRTQGQASEWAHGRWRRWL